MKGLQVIPGFMSASDCQRVSSLIDRLKKYADVAPPAMQGWSIPSWGLPQEFWGEMEWLRSKGRELGKNLETLRFSEMREGHFHELHKDNLKLDGVTPNHTPQRTSAALVYVTDCGGGELCLPDLKAVIAPVIGQAVTFPAEYSHRVDVVSAGIRQAITCWYVGGTK